jgi:hypothetical protein
VVSIATLRVNRQGGAECRRGVVTPACGKRYRPRGHVGAGVIWHQSQRSVSGVLSIREAILELGQGVGQPGMSLPG